MPKLYLIPTTLSNQIEFSVILPYQLLQIKHVKYFIVETVKTARQHIKYLKLDTPIQNLSIVELNKHTVDIKGLLQPLFDGLDIGLMSDCGMPCIADPGDIVVSLAHRYKFEVIPLFGSSSILLGLMSSGLNGQNFCFNGYFPIDDKSRYIKIKQIQQLILETRQTQIFIETPFRVRQLLKYFIDNCNNEIVLVLAINLMQSNQKIIRHTINKWKDLYDDKFLISKEEVIFILGV